MYTGTGRTVEGWQQQGNAYVQDVPTDIFSSAITRDAEAIP